MLVGEPVQLNKYVGGPRLFHSLLVKYYRKNNKDIKVLDPRGKSISSNKFFQLFNVFKEYFSQKPSVIIITTFGFHIFFVCLLQKIYGVKVISVLHSLNRVSNYEKSKFSFSLDYFRNNLFRNYLENILLKHSFIQIFPSTFFLKNCIDNDYDLSNPKVISHALEESNIINEKHLNYSKIFCIIGSLLEIKGTDRINVIVDSLPEGHSLEWIGYDNKDEVQKNNTAHQFINDKFSIHKYVSSDKIALLLDKFDILFVPSHFESFGIVILESCARGVPVIISQNVGAKEIVERFNAGLTCTFSSSVEISKCINEILKNYSSYSSNGINLAKNYTWDKVIEEYIKILN